MDAIASRFAIERIIAIENTDQLPSHALLSSAIFIICRSSCTRSIKRTASMTTVEL